MKLSEKRYAFLGNEESFKLTSYQDSAGVLTIRTGKKQYKCEVQFFDTSGNTWKRIAGSWF